jgi:hypothetical protein
LKKDRNVLEPKLEVSEAEGDLLLGHVCFVVEVDAAEKLVGKLFRRRFGIDSFPEEPRHFVAFAVLPDGSLLTLGYVHYTIWESSALCGGLVIDERHYRKLPAHTRKLIKQAGGVAELLLESSFSRLSESTIAIWGHVGDLQSEKVCSRVGFEHTDSEHVMVVWRSSSLSSAEKQNWVNRVAALGAF